MMKLQKQYIINEGDALSVTELLEELLYANESEAMEESLQEAVDTMRKVMAGGDDAPEQETSAEPQSEDSVEANKEFYARDTLAAEEASA
jgi:hypothetical protein